VGRNMLVWRMDLGEGLGIVLVMNDFRRCNCGSYSL